MPTALGGVPGAGAFDEDLSHQPRRDAEKVGAVAGGCGAAAQPEPGFVHQRGGVECLARPLPPHLRARDSSQLVIDEWQQRVERALLAGSRRGQQRRHGRAPTVGHL